MYRSCISDALSIWDSTTVNNSNSTKKKKKDIQTCQHLWFDREMITCDNAGFSQNTLVFMLKKLLKYFFLGKMF